jgi:hypothetical protein
LIETRAVPDKHKDSSPREPLEQEKTYSLHFTGGCHAVPIPRPPRRTHDDNGGFLFAKGKHDRPSIRPGRIRGRVPIRRWRTVTTKARISRASANVSNKPFQPPSRYPDGWEMVNLFCQAVRKLPVVFTNITQISQRQSGARPFDKRVDDI